ncbi:MAG: endo alpha-1,4 polygalactosaminidase [Deltaproteobacteria bacterium]|nr:endo alpha-1,4 polygalactosaminidase [Deltaproteobacteria bacterium]
MRRYSLRGLVSAFFLFLFYSNLFATELSLAPQSYTTQSGSTSGQPVSTLAMQDQSGSQDDWNQYLEFYTPGNSIYKGQRAYIVPASVDLTQIQGLALRVNYRGPQKNYQTWSWKIYDWVGRKWVGIGDNGFAAPWIWQMANFQIGGKPTNYINSKRQLSILFQSNNAKDDADLDYEALVLTLPNQTPVPDSSTRWIPPPVSSWQWQFSGLPIDTSVNAEIFSLDGFDTDAALVAELHAQGKHVVCYMDMGTWEDWRPDASQFPASVKGLGNGWPGENWLDIRRLDILLPLLEARLDLCHAKGFDAVEPDNMDGYSNTTGFPLTANDQLQFNQTIAEAAHVRGLSIGLKNDISQVANLLPHYDFAINESCFEFGECALLNPFVDAAKAVFNVEYNLAINDFCPQANAMNFNSMKKNRNLDAYREACR